ncbi:MAG: hypothetical protein ICV85_09285 [Tolypothrix sp. T3-bin4]|nr:hypothetical protein [Tolypothrix sp. Co-bin9]MBD0302355.1 hypothetical protein [Tolypothrix sp. T3-bin4]
MTYTHLHRVNKEANGAPVAEKMNLSKSFNWKPGRKASSSLLSSILAISILGIADKSIAEFPAVMRIDQREIKGNVFIRQEPSMLEYFVDEEYNLNTNVYEKYKNINRLGELINERIPDKNYYLIPTTIVILDGCTQNGWCRLIGIRRGNATWQQKIYERYQKDLREYNPVVPLEAWVPATYFCDIYSAGNLQDCSSLTKEYVRYYRLDTFLK